MQGTLSGLTRDHSNGYCYYTLGGMRIYNLASQLVNCTNLTKVEFTGLSYSGTIDLSNVVNKCTIGYTSTDVGKIILPKYISSLRIGSSNLDFSNVIEVETVQLETTSLSAYCNSIIELNYYNVSVSNVLVYYLTLGEDYKFSYTDPYTNISITDFHLGKLLNMLGVTGLNSFKTSTSTGAKLSIAINNLDDLDFSSFGNLTNLYLENCYLSNLDFISKCTALQTVTLTNCSITDITGLMNLTNITTLNLSSNSITGLYALKNLTALTSLTLTDNCIYDKKMTYTDSEGTVTEYYNLQILYDLNYGGALSTLYLSGNYIDDYSLISGLSWIDKDF